MHEIGKRQSIINLIVYCLGYTLIFPFLASLMLSFFPEKTAQMLSPLFEGIIYGITFVVVVKGSINILKKDWYIFKEKTKAVLKEVLKHQGLIYLLNLLCNLIILFLTGDEVSNNQAQVIEMLKTRTVSTVMLTVLFAPIVEELVFRGSIFSLVYEKNKILGILLASCSFGFLHVFSSIYLGDWKDLLYLLSYSAMGFCLCRCYIKTGTIYGSIFLHALNNSISVLLLLSL